jgi:hypothetical protein
MVAATPAHSTPDGGRVVDVVVVGATMVLVVDVVVDVVEVVDDVELVEVDEVELVEVELVEVELVEVELVEVELVEVDVVLEVGTGCQLGSVSLAGNGTGSSVRPDPSALTTKMSSPLGAGAALEW